MSIVGTPFIDLLIVFGSAYKDPYNTTNKRVFRGDVHPWLHNTNPNMQVVQYLIYMSNCLFSLLNIVPLIYIQLISTHNHIFLLISSFHPIKTVYSSCYTKEPWAFEVLVIHPLKLNREKRFCWGKVLLNYNRKRKRKTPFPLITFWYLNFNKSKRLIIYVVVLKLSIMIWYNVVTTKPKNITCMSSNNVVTTIT